MKRASRGKIEKATVGNVTVKIYRRSKPGGYTYFEVADYSKGARRLRSFADLTAARKEATAIAQKIATGETMAAQIRGKDAAAWAQAVETLRPTGTPLLVAVTRYAEAFQILGGDRLLESAKDYARRNPVQRQARTVREVAHELLALKEKRGVSARYSEDLRTRLDKLATAFAVDVAHVTTADIQAWLDAMKAAPRSVKNFRDTANTLFKFAEARGYIARGENPVAATQKVETRNGEPIEIFSPLELRRLIDAAPEFFKSVLAIQAFAGLRSAEVMRLDWQDVKLDRGHIEVGADKSKTASRRLVPISANLMQWLANSRPKSGKGRVFPHSRAYFHEVQRNLAAATGGEKVKPVEWKHNALRHSFISYRVAEISDVPKVALESGNSPAMIFAHYRELVTKEDASEWFAISPAKPTNLVVLEDVAPVTTHTQQETTAK